MQDRPKLGEILVQAGVIDELQLASALGEHQRWGRRLGVTLIKLGMVEEGHLIRALAQQLDLPIASLGGKRIADEVIALVPAKVASEHGVIPLFVKPGEKGRDHLYLGMEDPSNIAVLDDLSFRTGLEVHPVMVTPSDLGAAIDRYYFARPERASARSASAARPDETLGMPNLHRVAGDPGSPSPSRGATAEAVPQPQPGRASQPDAQPGARPEAQPEAQPGARPSVELAPQTRRRPDQEIEIDLDQEVQELEREDPTPGSPEEWVEAVARALESSERTRLVTKALTQLLIEKGVLDLAEIQTRVARLKGGAEVDPSKDA